MMGEKVKEFSGGYRSKVTRAPRKVASVVLTTALALSGAAVITVVGTAPAAQAAVPATACPAVGEMPPIGNVLTYTDRTPAIFVGGDYLATGDAAESEGLVVVQGNAVFDNPGGVFNVGSVGVGSGIVPPPAGPMLQVGGTLTVNAAMSLDVGAGVDGGGDVLVGSTASGNIITNGGTLSDSLGAGPAIAPHGAYLASITATSSDLAGRTPTGTTTAEFGASNFVGSGATDLEVFAVDAAQLAATGEVYFTNIAPNAPIVVNVTGGPLTYTQTYVALNGERVDAFGPNFGNAASQILWNFVDAPAVNLGGSSQFMGSILAPNSDLSTTASTNGRVLVGGDFTTQGSGNEQHSYPWIGGFGLSCASEPAAAVVGGFSAAKVVTGDAAGSVPAGTEFTLEYSYMDADSGTVEGSLTLGADGAIVAGPQALPVGTIVTFSETNLPVISGVEWGTPVLSATTITITAGSNEQVTVTNTANTAAAVVGDAGTPPTSGLSSTGGSAPGGPLLLAALLLGAGALTSVMARRRTVNSASEGNSAARYTGA